MKSISLVLLVGATLVLSACGAPDLNHSPIASGSADPINKNEELKPIPPIGANPSTPQASIYGLWSADLSSSEIKIHVNLQINSHSLVVENTCYSSVAPKGGIGFSSSFLLIGSALPLAIGE